MATLEDFRKIEFKTARVVGVHEIPGADRIWRLVIDLGGATREVVAGIRGHYSPEELAGKTVIVAANLEPAVIRGVRSEGMILAVRDGEKMAVLTPDRPVRSGLSVS